MPDTSLPFQGIFEEYHRQKLIWIMQTAHLKPKDLAYILECSDSSVRQWLNGKNRRCQTHFIPAFQILFSGELDDLFREAGSWHGRMRT